MRAIGSEVPGRFAANLIRLRQAAGFSQEELASRAAVHRTQISLVEGGERLPRLETLVKIVGALGVTCGDLLDGIAWAPVVSSPGGFRVAVSAGIRTTPSPGANGHRCRGKR